MSVTKDNGEHSREGGGKRAFARPSDGRADAVSALRLALGNTGIFIICQDRDLCVSWSENIPPAWSPNDIVGARDEDYLPAQEAARLTELKQAVLASGRSEKAQISLPGAQGDRWFDIWIDAAPDDGGIVMTVMETTEQRRREETLRTLLREVSHRSKNLLSIIQSVATQTGRYSTGIESFLARFRGRIQSLASSQDLVTSSNWRGANLHELVAGQLARYCADPEHNIRLTGENPYFTPNAALHIGLALHELAVNSVSFGALARPNGFVSIDAHLTRDGADGPQRIEMVWSERVPIDIETLKEKRFGSVALERVVPASLDGSAEIRADAAGLEYRLTVPAGNFEPA